MRRFSIEALDALAERDVKALVVACNTSTAVALARPARPATTCRSSASSGPGAAAAALATRNRRVGVIATPATVRSHAYFNAIKDENPAVEVYEHATPALRADGRGRPPGRRRVEAAVAEALAPLLGERDGGGRVRLPAPAVGADRHAAPGLHALPAAAAGHRARRSGDRVAIVDSATATASALAELLSVNGLEAPGTTRGTAATPGAAGHSRPRTRCRRRPTHVQLTTGDVDAFRSIAARMFGEAFPDVGAGRAAGRLG